MDNLCEKLADCLVDLVGDQRERLDTAWNELARMLYLDMYWSREFVTGLWPSCAHYHDSLWGDTTGPYDELTDLYHLDSEIGRWWNPPWNKRGVEEIIPCIIGKEWSYEPSGDAILTKFLSPYDYSGSMSSKMEEHFTRLTAPGFDQDVFVVANEEEVSFTYEDEFDFQSANWDVDVDVDAFIELKDDGGTEVLYTFDYMVQDAQGTVLSTDTFKFSTGTDTGNLALSDLVENWTFDLKLDDGGFNLHFESRMDFLEGGGVVAGDLVNAFSLFTEDGEANIITDIAVELPRSKEGTQITGLDMNTNLTWGQNQPELLSGIKFDQYVYVDQTASLNEPDAANDQLATVSVVTDADWIDEYVSEKGFRDAWQLEDKFEGTVTEAKTWTDNLRLLGSMDVDVVQTSTWERGQLSTG